MNRRDFLKDAAVVSLAAQTPVLEKGDPSGEPVAQPAPQVTPNVPFVGIHIAAHSFFDEGITRCLDLLQETASVNALFVSSNSYYGAMVRPREVQADHGVPIRDGRGRRLTPIFFRPNARHYNTTRLRHPALDRNLEYAGREIFAELAEPARRRGIKIYERLYEPGTALRDGLIVNGTEVLTVDCNGQRGAKPCWNHPDYRAWLAASLTDLFTTYRLDGIQYGAERLGPLSALLHSGSPGTCFCTHCMRRADQAGLDANRPRQGLRQLHQYLQSLSGANARPTDGALVGFLRLLLGCPELLTWEKLQYDAMDEIHCLVRDTVKRANPQAHVGRHVDHAQGSYDLLFRAAYPYERMARSAEFLKISTYHEIAGPRIKSLWVDHMGRSLLKDLSGDQILGLFYALTGNDARAEPPLDRVAEVGLSPEYVFRETRRCVQGVDGRAAVYSGIAVDIPRGGNWGNQPWPSDLDQVRRAVNRALDAGTAGLVICREYEEIRLPSLRTIGRALSDRRAPR